jgi:hypothetical protein
MPSTNSDTYYKNNYKTLHHTENFQLGAFKGKNVISEISDQKSVFKKTCGH